jgi:hypothetical protein
MVNRCFSCLTPNDAGRAEQVAIRVRRRDACRPGRGPSFLCAVLEYLLQLLQVGR